MTRMQDLFASQRRRDERVINTLGNPATDRRLEAMFDGAPRVTAERRDSPDEVNALSELISTRRVATPAPRGAKKPIRARRSRGRRDWMSIGAASLAVVSVVTASTLVGISVASASPASEAVGTLTANEAVLANSIERVNSGISALEQTRTNAKTDAEALAAPLAALGQIAQLPSLGPAEAARQALLTEIDRVPMPQPVAAYRRPAIDGDSLESVGTAIDVVDSRTREAQAVSSQLSDLRDSLDKTVRPLDEAVAAVAGELPSLATTLVTENELAEETLRTNVTTLAARVGTVDTHSSPSAISDFVNAVTLLRAGQRAAQIDLEEREAAAEAERRRLLELQRQQQQQDQQPQPSTPSQSPAPSSPPESGSGDTDSGGGSTDGGAGTGGGGTTVPGTDTGTTDPGTGTDTGTGTGTTTP